MISGIVVNKKVYKEFEKLPLGKTLKSPSGIPYFPLNSISIYVRPYIKTMKVYFDIESLRKELEK